MGAGRGGGGAARRLGLRLPAGRAGRARLEPAAVARGRGQSVGLNLVLVAELVEALLHLFHLALETVDIAGAACAAAAFAADRRRLVGLGRLTFAPRKRRKHTER